MPTVKSLRWCVNGFQTEIFTIKGSETDISRIYRFTDNYCKLVHQYWICFCFQCKHRLLQQSPTYQILYQSLTFHFNFSISSPPCLLQEVVHRLKTCQHQQKTYGMYIFFIGFISYCFCYFMIFMFMKRRINHLSFYTIFT